MQVASRYISSSMDTLNIYLFITYMAYSTVIHKIDIFIFIIYIHNFDSVLISLSLLILYTVLLMHVNYYY